MQKQIIHANIVLPDRIIFDGSCAFSDGFITYAGENNAPLCADITDAEGAWLLPGFIDIHCHGGDGSDFMDADIESGRRISAFHLAHGTTTLLATTMTGSWDEIYKALDCISSLIKEENNIDGVHLEGPWFSPKQCGAQDPSCMDSPSPEKLKALIEKYPFIKRISVAPELEGGMSTGKAGREAGIVMSVGHTDADFAAVTEAADNGYSLMTHLYSGMKMTERVELYRVAGAVEAGLYDDRLYVELIADGKHLPVELLKYVYKLKGADKISLITDATRGAGLPDGTVTYLREGVEGSKTVIEDGVAKLYDRTGFAGSVASADRLLRVMHLDAGIPLTHVSRMMSGVPAEIMGYTDRGTIEVGKRADLLIFDSEFNIKNVYIKGEKI